MDPNFKMYHFRSVTWGKKEGKKSDHFYPFFGAIFYVLAILGHFWVYFDICKDLKLFSDFLDPTNRKSKQSSKTY